MNWDDLRIFLAVARMGQIGRAAPQLGLDATTVGRRLRKLERTLGDALFEQTRDGQRLTGAGERLLHRAEKVDAAMGGLEEDVADLPKGLVRTSASEGFATWFLAPRLPAFARAQPAIEVDIAVINGFLSPSKRETDLAILLGRPRRGPLVTRKLTDYGLRLFATPAYLDKHPPIRTRDDLRSHPLIGYIPDLLYAPELNYLDEVTPGLQPTLRSTSISVQHRIVASGGGIAVLPCFMGDADPGLVRILPEVRIARSFWLVIHEETRAIRRTRCFVDWLVETAAAERDFLLGL